MNEVNILEHDLVPEHIVLDTDEEEAFLKKYNITRDASPWRGFTSSYIEEEASKEIMAQKIKGSDFKAIPSLAKYSRSGMIVISRCEKLHRIAVDSSLFSDLKRADATYKAQGRFLIGIYKDTSFKKFKPHELAEFLIESQIINTFWHIESEICLIAEKDSTSEYTAYYKGKHVYFTNSKNEESLGFTIIIKKKSGEMFIETM